MKISSKDFIASPNKAVTLIGMSGAGKSHISALMQGWGWRNYSCDYEIGDKYLKNELAGEFSSDDIGALSVYLGKLGASDKGGFALDKFNSRQRAYYDAEVKALYALEQDISLAEVPFIHDSTGSLCEIEDDALMQKIGEKTLFVYLKAGAAEEKEVLERAKNYPKPLFFPPKFLASNLKIYLSEFNIASIDDIVPDEFARWVFPILFEARKPKYQNLADKYGVSIPAAEFRDLKSSQEFEEIIAKYLD